MTVSEAIRRRWTGDTWRNWAGNQWATPARVERPRDEADIVAAVRSAAAEGLPVKVVGAGHSFTDIACTDGVLVTLDDHTGVLAVDHAAGEVTVAAGTRIHDLSPRLRALGLALPNLGDIDVQTVAGAVSTGTHGTGLRWRCISDAVVGFRLVLADGSVLDTADDPEVLAVGRVGLGALGVLSTVTLRCVPAFNLHTVEDGASVDAVLADLDAHVEGTDHFEFFWVPDTRVALTKHHTRTQDEPTGGSWRRRLTQEATENLGFGLVNRVGRRVPALIPRLARALPSSGRVEYVAPSHEVFSSPRRVRFLEMEYAIPRGALPEALAAVRAVVAGLSHPISFPVEVRFLGADDIPLSMATGRDSAFVAVHVYRGTPYEAYFDGVEQIMRAVGGRPHWGKLHRRSAASLAEVYPRLGEFVAVRDRLDPGRRFANAYLDRVLGA